MKNREYSTKEIDRILDNRRGIFASAVNLANIEEQVKEILANGYDDIYRISEVTESKGKPRIHLRHTASSIPDIYVGYWKEPLFYFTYVSLATGDAHNNEELEEREYLKRLKNGERAIKLAHEIQNLIY